MAYEERLTMPVESPGFYKMWRAFILISHGLHTNCSPVTS